MSQLSLLLSDTNDFKIINSNSIWLGLRIDHRFLFSSLQDEWITSKSKIEPLILGIQRLNNITSTEEYTNKIYVSLIISPNLLPNLSVNIKTNGEWNIKKISEINSNDELLIWPEILPFFSVKNYLVANKEDLIHLSSMSKQISNIHLPKLELLTQEYLCTSYKNQNFISFEYELALLQKIDAIRGAIAMAVYSVPRIAPWLDVLTQSFRIDEQEKLKTLTNLLSAPWWTITPWSDRNDNYTSNNLQENVWQNAINTFQEHSGLSDFKDPKNLLSILISKTNIGTEINKKIISKWNSDTIELLEGKTNFSLANWKEFPVGKSLQLVLLRPDPNNFLSWLEDFPDLPLAVWWSAATLCGLLNGYKRLENKFRGDLSQRKVFNSFILSKYSKSQDSFNFYQDSHASTFSWSMKGDAIVLSWGNQSIWTKPIHSRGMWFNQQLEDESLRSEAINIATKLKLNCFDKKIKIPTQFLEPLLLALENQKDNDEVSFILPQSSNIERIFNPSKFKMCIATEGFGSIPFPHEINQIKSTESSEEIPGLTYVTNFITSEKEKELLKIIDNSKWMIDLQRRVQHYGWKYDYKSRKIDHSMHLGKLPDWAQELAELLYSKGLVPYMPDQLIVNEYVSKQGISKHIDCIPCFEDGIAMISLNEAWDLILSPKDIPQIKISKTLDSKSVLILKGESRKSWTHEIPKRLKEPNGLRRTRRVSLTFRKVKL